MQQLLASLNLHLNKLEIDCDSNNNLYQGKMEEAWFIGHQEQTQCRTADRIPIYYNQQPNNGLAPNSNY